MSSEQQKTPETGESLSERLKKAYKRISFGLREEATKDFADYHRIHPDTLRKKMNAAGGCIVTESECEWLEKWKPKPVAV